jgi:hypothetical protein
MGIGVLAVSSCFATATSDQLRARAAFDMHCDGRSLQIVNLDARTRGVSGCGQQLTYVESCDGNRNDFNTECTWVVNANGSARAQAPLARPVTAPPPLVKAATVTAAPAVEDANVAAAEGAAMAWLALVDAGQFSQSWDRASVLFRDAVTKPEWQAALKGVRSPLGSIQVRNLKSAAFTRSLPGAPEADYVVIQYTSRFEKRPAATETVTPMREKDGTWKVSGYFIK